MKRPQELYYDLFSMSAYRNPHISSIEGGDADWLYGLETAEDKTNF